MGFVKLFGQPAIWLLGLAALMSYQVDAAAIDSNPALCGGYNQPPCPEDYGYDDDAYGPLEKRQTNRTTSFTPVIGVPNRVVDRRSITVLQEDRYRDLFNMILLAWASLQARDESVSTSYYQVSGIHGLPFIPWEPNSPTVDPNRGYCTHRSALFLTWHRPYMALFEQLLQQEAVTIARRFRGADAQRYQTAANDVRLPYWDWAARGSGTGIPPIVSQSTVTVTRPRSDGTSERATIPNPLAAYRFLRPQTFIGERTQRDPSAQSTSFESSTREATYRSLLQTNYDAYQRQAESIHDGVHVDVGGNMANIGTSAFDPIFWLHHSNVDRLMAIFQASRPGSYLSPRTPGTRTFALRGDRDDLQTPLYPFRRSTGREWTSDDIKTADSIFGYGYSYPEVPTGRSRDDLRRFATQRFRELYGPTTARSNALRIGSADAAARPQSPTVRRDWAANVIVRSADLSGSYRIKFYAGSPNDNNLIGRAGIFGDPLFRPAGGVEYLNITVPLTGALEDKNIGTQADSVVPKLRSDFRWVIERVGATGSGEVPLSSIPSLQVAVTSSVIQASQDLTQLPVITNPLTHVAPTLNKPGGIKADAPPPVGEKAPQAIDTGLTGGSSNSTGSSN